MQPAFVKVVLFDPVSEDPTLGEGTQAFDGLTVDIALIEPYRPERADRVLRLDPDRASRLFVARSPRYVASREHFFRVGFSKRNFSKVTRTLLTEGEVTPELRPISSPARLPYWDSGWDDGYSTNEFFGDGDIITPSTAERPITLAIPLRRLYIIGHRGAPYRFPENTIASFRTALDLGANGLEFDICLTKGQASHDLPRPLPGSRRSGTRTSPTSSSLPRLTAILPSSASSATATTAWRVGGGCAPGTSFDIMKLSFEQVRRFYRYHHVGGQEQPIPDLDEFLAFAAGEVHRLDLLFFDMKSPPWHESREARKFRAYGQLLGETIHGYPTLPERLVVGNASEAVLRELQAGILSAGETRCEFAYDASGSFRAMLGPGLRTPSRSRAPMGNSVILGRGRGFDGETSRRSPRPRETGTTTRRASFPTVIHWTLNDPAQMFHSLSAGVNGIVTDRPDVLRLSSRRTTWSAAARAR